MVTPMRIASLAFFALAIGACDIPEDPVGPEQRKLLVHGVLDPDNVSHEFMVEWSDRSPRNPQGRATVSLIMPDGRERQATPVTVLGEPSGNAERYILSASTVNDMVQRCDTYGLRVVDGPTVVTGSTTIPCAPPGEAVFGAREFSRTRDTLRLSWPRVPGAKAYYVALRSRFASSPIDPGVNYFYSLFADTSIVYPGTMRTPENESVFMTGANVTVLISAVDDNFYTYYHAQIDPFAGAPPSRLDGALGVFGSSVPIVRQGLTVVP